MRFKLFLGLVCLIIVAGAVMLLSSGDSLLKFPSSQPTPVASNIQPVPVQPSAVPTGSLPDKTRIKSSQPEKHVAAKVAEEPSGSSYTEKLIAELQDLAMEDDAASLNTILSELNNPDHAIRQAAVEATMTFGSRDAIPRLEEAVAQTENVQEKKAIQDAIDYLKLPSLTEVMQEQRSQGVQTTEH